MAMTGCRKSYAGGKTEWLVDRKGSDSLNSAVEVEYFDLILKTKIPKIFLAIKICEESGSMNHGVALDSHM